MEQRTRQNLFSVAEGALGGALGTLFMKQAMALSARLPESLQGPELKGDPGAFIASRLPLVPAEMRERIASGLHWGYGTFWPTVAGAVARRFGLRRPRDIALAGAGLGAAVWAIGYLGWLPATKQLVRPVYRERPSRVLSSLLSHVAYGALAVGPLVVDNVVDARLRRRRAKRFGRWLREFVR